MKRIVAMAGITVFSVTVTGMSAELAGTAPRQPGDRTTVPALAMSLPDSAVDAARRKRIVDTLINRLERLYVFPEQVPMLAAKIRERMARGDYDAITSAPAFADTLTRHVREIVKDQHLGVRFMVRRRRAPVTPTPTPAPAPVQPRVATGGITKVDLLPGNIGYVALDGFESVDEVDAPYANAMNQLAATDALIIDIRANGGGWPHSVALFISYLVGTDSIHINSLRFRDGDSTMRFFTSPKVTGRKFGPTKPVFVLTSERTFSAAEEFAYDLKAMKRATIIGEQTRGGANPGQATMLDDDFAAFVPFAVAVNPITNGNWEGTGVTPDIRVPARDALDRAIAEARRQVESKKGR
jgi:C-terminal processing protease CtpA/Prc